METNPVFLIILPRGTYIMKIIEDLGQILVVLHTLLVIIEMPPRLNKQSGSVENFVLLKCRKLRREDQETSDSIVSRISLFYDMCCYLQSSKISS